jgi:hypothetical protein
VRAGTKSNLTKQKQLPVKRNQRAVLFSSRIVAWSLLSFTPPESMLNVTVFSLVQGYRGSGVHHRAICRGSQTRNLSGYTFIKNKTKENSVPVEKNNVNAVIYQTNSQASQDVEKGANNLI